MICFVRHSPGWRLGGGDREGVVGQSGGKSVSWSLPAIMGDNTVISMPCYELASAIAPCFVCLAACVVAVDFGGGGGGAVDWGGGAGELFLV